MDSPSILRSLIALFFVSGLIVIIALIIKKLGLNYPMAKKTSHKRITIEEVTILDPRRRLVLVRRDHIEHLILLGATSETVIESHPIHEQTE